MIGSLPPHLATVEIGDLASLAAEELFLRPRLVSQSPVRSAGGRALVYARAAGSSYDEIGYRSLAATPHPGPIPLQTLPRMQRQRETHLRRAAQTAMEQIRAQQPNFRHRSLQLQDGRFRYEFREGVFVCTQVRDPGDWKTDGERFFSLINPPAPLLHNSKDDDASLILPQKYQVKLPGARWLPLDRLISRGRFLPMQQLTDELATQTSPGNYYCFLSHRWFSPAHPDPVGEQARFIAWQFVNCLCEAVRVAHARGLHIPRRKNSATAMHLGITGSELAESLLVNVLRFALDDECLKVAVEEVECLEKGIGDDMIDPARGDENLDVLKDALAMMPVLQALTARVFLWYDFSCVPQPPRSSSDESLFQECLKSLNLFQVFGGTAILLNEPEDYLSRAWCTLEAVFADSLGLPLHLLLGSMQADAHQTGRAGYFGTVLEDRPHLVWRGLLDTELFGVQSPETCMIRLGLAMSDPNDLDYLYGQVQNFAAPRKVHVDASELVTGVYPVAVVDRDGEASLVLNKLGRVVSELPAGPALSLDWTAALKLSSGWDKENDHPAAIAPYLMLPAAEGNGAPACHVAVVASCEGEAILFGNWLLKHVAELEALTGTRVSSCSWLAADIAPVGHFIHGSLQARTVEARVWAVVAASVRFMHCDLTGALDRAAKAAGLDLIRVFIDLAEDNIHVIRHADAAARDAGDDEGAVVTPRAAVSCPVVAGGVFRSALPQALFEARDSHAS